MSQKKVDSGRVETILAAVVLLAVIGLFIRFQLVADAPTEQPDVQPAVTEVHQPTGTVAEE